ncbi:uncharacterized protein LOC118200486 isoform X1 [Stegodyphus dumicola]|uniref:uncharacterized protein LOC118200486 isoform X1 n=1 Tax=Stegodyphus dumicola TaxID=202533 RepID=UPI0015B018DF|nr:uncharacterized protein LOC118200486 isoform X1 [Stegodyphus dumicola]
MFYDLIMEFFSIFLRLGCVLLSAACFISCVLFSAMCFLSMKVYELLLLGFSLYVQLGDKLINAFSSFFTLDDFDFGYEYVVTTPGKRSYVLMNNLHDVYHEEKLTLDHQSEYQLSLIDHDCHYADCFSDSNEQWTILNSNITFLISGSMEMKEFKRATFNAHNNYRTMHGCPPLIMSEELSSAAQTWAERIAEKGFLQYSENPGVGENICLIDLDQASKTGEQIVNDWYKEIHNYNYNKPGWKRGAYHFSQLLWKSTTEIGVGVARIPGQNKAFVVVNYRPGGNNNMPGEFERNVLPPQKKKISDDNANLRQNINRR